MKKYLYKFFLIAVIFTTFSSGVFFGYKKWYIDYIKETKYIISCKPFEEDFLHTVGFKDRDDCVMFNKELEDDYKKDCLNTLEKTNDKDFDGMSLNSCVYHLFSRARISLNTKYYLFKNKNDEEKVTVTNVSIGLEKSVNDDYTDDFSILKSYNAFLNKPHEFDSFSVAFREYNVADVKFEGDFTLKENPNYWNDWKTIFSDIKNSNFDFAGHYKILSTGNGTMKDLYLVDGFTGKIYSPKEMMATGPSTYLFKNNSRLLVLVMDNTGGFVPETKEDKVYFYYLLQDNKSFKLLGAYVYKNNKFVKVNL